MSRDPSQLPRTIDDIRSFLVANKEADVVFTNKQERVDWIQKTLREFHYEYRSRDEKGLMRQYLMKITGYSRAQMARHITHYTQAPLPSPSETIPSVKERPLPQASRTPSLRILTASALSLVILSIAGAQFKPKTALVFHNTEQEKIALDAEDIASRALPLLRNFSISTTGGTQYLTRSKPYPLGTFPSGYGSTVRIQSTIATVTPSPEGEATIQPLFTQEERLTRIDDNRALYQQERNADLQENSWARRLRRIFAGREREKQI